MVNKACQGSYTFYSMFRLWKSGGSWSTKKKNVGILTIPNAKSCFYLNFLFVSGSPGVFICICTTTQLVCKWKQILQHKDLPCFIYGAGSCLLCDSYSRPIIVECCKLLLFYYSFIFSFSYPIRIFQVSAEDGRASEYPARTHSFRGYIIPDWRSFSFIHYVSTA